MIENLKEKKEQVEHWFNIIGEINQGACINKEQILVLIEVLDLLDSMIKNMDNQLKESESDE